MSLAYRMDFAVEIPSTQSGLAKPINIQDSCLSKLDDQAPTSTSSESSVTCIYQAPVAGSLRNIAITWSNISSCHTLAITIENFSDDDHQTCQIEFQSWQFWSRKGLKSLQVDDERVDIFWDLRAVKFSSTNPEPHSGYYISIVFDKQMVLLLGDLMTEAYKRTMSKRSPVAPILLHKEEILYGKNCFHTRMLLEDGPNEHDVVIENSMLRHGEPELRISIDGRMLVRVMHLNWRFRGNETALVNNVPVQIFWDVYDWLFSNPGEPGHGLFIFKPGPLKNALNDNCRDISDRRRGNRVEDDENETEQNPSAGGCCHFVFAVKVAD